MHKDLSESELEARFTAFKKANPPDSMDYLERLRPLLIRFHLDGYSRAAMFRFLKAENLVSCHAATFYRWLSDNVDFKAEARAWLEKQSSAAETEMRSMPSAPPASMPPKRAAAEGQPAEQGRAARAARAGPAAQAGPASSDDSKKLSGTGTSTESTTVESSFDTTKSMADDERNRFLRAVNSQLETLESQDMGAVSDRALARLKERDQARQGRDG